MREKTLRASKDWRPKISSKHEKIVAIMVLLNVTQEKVRALKYGYTANDEFKELRKLVERI